jgi:hypothetical protein
MHFRNLGGYASEENPRLSLRKQRRVRLGKAEPFRTSGGKAARE